MAFSHGSKAVFTLSATDITAYLDNIDANFEREMVEIRTMGTQSWMKRMPGLRLGTVSVSGTFDKALMDVVWAAWNGDVAVAWVYSPQGSTAGLPKFSGNCRVTSFKPGPAAANDVLKLSFELVNDDTITYGTN
jgi:hypothetical protein